MGLKNLCHLWIFFCLKSLQAIDWSGFSEIAIPYFKARHVTPITVVNCFGAQDNFQLSKTFMERDLYVQINGNLSNFNATSQAASGVAVDGTCNDKVRDLLKHSAINEFMRTNIFWLFMESASNSTEQGIPDAIRALYNERFRSIEALPGSRVVVAVFHSTFWRLFDIHKKHSKGVLMFIEICFRGRSLTTMTNMERALRRMDKNSRERRNLRGYSMPTGLTVW